MENYVRKAFSVGKEVTSKKMRMKTMALLGFLFLFPINCMAQQDGLNNEIVSQEDEFNRKEEVSKIIHGKDETKFQKALIKIVIKYVSILQYGVEGRLSMAEEALVHATCRTEREAGKILGPFMGRAFFYYV